MRGDGGVNHSYIECGGGDRVESRSRRELLKYVAQIRGGYLC